MSIEADVGWFLAGLDMAYFLVDHPELDPAAVLVDTMVIASANIGRPIERAELEAKVADNPDDLAALVAVVDRMRAAKLDR